jgi:protein-S-isoprenylcysteine O-methyltransferase Ste14
MHSTSTGPSNSERCRELPSMRWPLSRIRILVLLAVLFTVLLAVLFTVGDQQQRREQWRRVQQERKTELVASGFVRFVHACRGAGAHAGPRKRREASAPA